MTTIIRPYTAADWPEVERINREGIETGHATFDSRPKPREIWENDSLPWSQLVADKDGTVVGWACLWPHSDRCCYAGIAEISIYIASNARGHGIGGALIRRCLAVSEDNGYWTVTAGIFPENTASVKLHEACGFRLVGVREKMGQMTYGPMTGMWRNNLLFERRSQVVGC